MEDRHGWILISKTPARKSKIVVLLFFVPQAFKAELKAEPDFRYTNILCALAPAGKLAGWPARLSGSRRQSRGWPAR